MSFGRLKVSDEVMPEQRKASKMVFKTERKVEGETPTMVHQPTGGLSETANVIENSILSMFAGDGVTA
jgi:hypothetical protein